jgi:3',5'-nucleoside bisphosphate phosphatase
VTSASAPPTPGAGGIDLHMHSTASDGSQTPAEVVAAARAARMHAIALTDHDTVAGIPAAREAAADGGPRIIAGVELSAYDGDDELHLLGLHLAAVDALSERLAVFQEARRHRAENIVTRLNEIGVRITFDDVLSVAGDATLGRPHVAKALVENGWARDLRDAFDRYLGLGRPGYLEKKRLSITDAISLVHECGGISVFAHPGGDGTLARVTPLVEAGLDGIEVLHPSHLAEDRARLQALVTHFDLVPSGGSDSHGATEGLRSIGALQVPVAWLALQEERVARVRSSLPPAVA